MTFGLVVSDWLYGAALFFNAALFIPQAWQIFKTKSANGSSLVTFAGFNVIQVMAFINGLYNHDYALIIGQCISFLACGLVTSQLIIYKIQSIHVNKKSHL